MPQPVRHIERLFVAAACSGPGVRCAGDVTGQGHVDVWTVDKLTTVNHCADAVRQHRAMVVMDRRRLTH